LADVVRGDSVLKNGWRFAEFAHSLPLNVPELSLVTPETFGIWREVWVSVRLATRYDLVDLCFVGLKFVFNLA